MNPLRQLLRNPSLLRTTSSSVLHSTGSPFHQNPRMFHTLLSKRASTSVQSPLEASRTSPRRTSRLFPQRRRPYSTNNTTKPPPPPPPYPQSGPGVPPPPSPPPQNQSLSARLRTLSRDYGYSAFGVYLLLTALDFPFCFAAVRYVGAERVGHYEHVIVEHVKAAIPEGVKDVWHSVTTAVMEAAYGPAREKIATEATDAIGMPGRELAEAQEQNQGENASIWTELALAYAIHKSFIFIRVPLTVAITPKVVKTLRGWGWNIGKRTPKTAPAK